MKKEDLNKYITFIKHHLGEKFYDKFQNAMFENPIVEFCGVGYYYYYNGLRGTIDAFYIIGTNDIDGLYDSIVLKNVKGMRYKIYKRMKYYSIIYYPNDIVNRKV